MERGFYKEARWDPSILGHTLPPFRPALVSKIRSWTANRQGLSPKDRPVFDQLMNFASARADAGSLSARPILSEVLFLSILVAQQRTIADLQEKICQLKKSLP